MKGRRKKQEESDEEQEAEEAEVGEVEEKVYNPIERLLVNINLIKSSPSRFNFNF
jgi:hypothetical protein